jgi:hypothetical protein
MHSRSIYVIGLHVLGVCHEMTVLSQSVDVTAHGAICTGGWLHRWGHGVQQDLFWTPGQADGQQLLDPFEIMIPGWRGLGLRLKLITGCPTGMGLPAVPRVPHACWSKFICEPKGTNY